MKIVRKEIDFYQCDYCDYTDRYPNGVKLHERSHIQCEHGEYFYMLDEEEILRQCGKCNIIDRVDLNGHEEAIFKMLKP